LIIPHFWEYNHHNIDFIGLEKAEGQGSAQQAKRFGVGFRYRETQPTVAKMVV